jgi:hypothetical protein
MAERLSDAEILAQIPAARARERAAWKAGLRAVAVRFDPETDRLLLELSSGYLLGVPIQELPHVAGAPRDSLADVSLGASGSAIRFAALDADYAVGGLVLALGAKIRGSRGGQVTSPEKAAAARANGAKGGRPQRRSP